MKKANQPNLIHLENRIQISNKNTYKGTNRKELAFNRYWTKTRNMY